MSTDINGINAVAPLGVSPKSADEGQARPLHALQNELDTMLQPTRLRMQAGMEGNRIVVQVIDASTGDVLRQIPSDEALRLAQEIARYQQNVIRA